jgi:hypothetical protein
LLEIQHFAVKSRTAHIPPGSSRDKVVFLTGRAKKGKNMFMFMLRDQINNGLNAINLWV